MEKRYDRSAKREAVRNIGFVKVIKAFYRNRACAKIKREGRGGGNKVVLCLTMVV